MSSKYFSFSHTNSYEFKSNLQTKTPKWTQRYKNTTSKKSRIPQSALVLLIAIQLKRARALVGNLFLKSWQRSVDDEWPTTPTCMTQRFLLVQQNIGISSCAVLAGQSSEDGGHLSATHHLRNLWTTYIYTISYIVYLSKQSCFSLQNVCVARVLV